MWRVVSNNDVPQLLDSLDLPGVAKYIKSESCKNVFVMAGAGISTSAGIPDFRSPDTGLYANLARLNLPYPEAVFDIGFFERNPRPFYVLAHELAPGKFRPTLTHSFIRLLSKKGLLHTCFTQNIDTLERAAGVPPQKIVEAHGSFADQHCVKCGASYPHEKIKRKIEEQEIPICEKPGCRGYVKPDIVFFGESLPSEFFSRVGHLRDGDLLIVMGTSLTVHPFASLTGLVPEECPRLLVNLDHVGGWGSRVNDVACLMPCDKAVRQICKLLGWEEELDALWAETDPTLKKRILTAVADNVPGGKVVGKPVEDKEEEIEETKAGAKEEISEAAKEGKGEEGRKDQKEKEERATEAETEGKKVSEELLENVVNELVESITGIRLEDDSKATHEVQGAPDVGNGESSSDKDTPESSKTNALSAKASKEDTPCNPRPTRDKDASPAPDESSNTSISPQTGKL